MGAAEGKRSSAPRVARATAASIVSSEIGNDLGRGAIAGANAPSSAAIARNSLRRSPNRTPSCCRSRSVRSRRTSAPTAFAWKAASYCSRPRLRSQPPMSMIVIMGMPYGIFRVIHGRVQGTGRDMIRGRPQMCGGQHRRGNTLSKAARHQRSLERFCVIEAFGPPRSRGRPGWRHRSTSSRLGEIESERNVAKGYLIAGYPRRCDACMTVGGLQGVIVLTSRKPILRIRVV